MLSYDSEGIEEIGVKDNCIILRYKTKEDAIRAYMKDFKKHILETKAIGVDEIFDKKQTEVNKEG